MSSITNFPAFEPACNVGCLWMHPAIATSSILKVTVMHEEALLGTAHPVLGPIGKAIDIGQIKAVFPSTKAAKVLLYYCADGKCGVPLTAVIVDETKLGRKISPSSYFRAQTKHKAVCARVSSPPVQTPVQPGGASVPASPSNSGFPVVWIDSFATGGNRGPNKNTASGSSGTPASGTGRQRSTVGTGVSKSQSQRLRLFVETWKTMSAAIQQSSQLIASWNPGGTYHSAFNNLTYTKRADVLTIGAKIHIGTLQGVTDTGTEYVISLAERNSGGKGQILTLILVKTDFTEPADAALLGALATISRTMPARPVFVYALGEFIGSGATLNLNLTHRNYLHLD